MSKTGTTDDQTVTTASPALYAFVAYETSRTGLTVSYKLGLGVYTNASGGWRNNRWACEFTINGTSKGINRTVKDQTSGAIGTTPYWPMNDTSGGKSKVTSKKTEPKYLYSGSTDVAASSNTMTVKINIRDTGYGTGETGRYSWGTPVNNWGTFIFSIPLDSTGITVPLYIYKQDQYGNNGNPIWWKDQYIIYGSTLNETWSPSGEEAYCYNSANIYETNVTTTANRYGTATRKRYYLDLNGRLDGSDAGSTGTYGTFSVKINGNIVQSNVNDYYTDHPYGTTFAFENINPTIGHTYKGVVEGSASGTITRETNTRLSFVTNQIYAKDPGNHQYKPGDLYVKRNGSWTRAAKSGYDSLIYKKTNGSWQRIDG